MRNDIAGKEIFLVAIVPFVVFLEYCQFYS